MLRLGLLLATAAGAAAKSCPVGKMDNLVAFGDSYTDENRKGYFADHDGEAPPPGTLLGENAHTSNDGYTWGRLVAKRSGAKYYNYGVGGASCSNRIVERQFADIDAPYPSVLEYQVDAFAADADFHDLYPDRHADNTVYALWVGTNDLGVGGFLTGDQKPGKDLDSFVDCNWDVLDRVYKAGGRRFILLNTVPLDLGPTYRAGAGDGPYWPDHSDYPQKQYQDKMHRQVSSVNNMFDISADFNLQVRRRWPGAALTVFDVHQLLKDVYDSPDQYLTKPGNATAPYHRCPSGGECVDSDEAPTSFLWYDELHPSEQTAGIVADVFIDIIEGRSDYGKCLRS